MKTVAAKDWQKGIGVVALPSNVILRYKKSGSGAPLILLHTIRTQLEYFQELEPLLAKHFTVYAIDLPGHGYSAIDKSAPYDEPYIRKCVVQFVDALDLRNVTLVGESIGGVLALTVASELPDRTAQVYASNVYDYDTRYGDGIRRGNRFANSIVGSLGLPVIGALAAAFENRWILKKIISGGYADPAKLSGDLLREFDRSGHRPNYRYVERKVLDQWQTWGQARALYPRVQARVTLIYGDKDWSRAAERQRTAAALKNPGVITLPDTGHFAAAENPNQFADIILNNKAGETSEPGIER